MVDFPADYRTRLGNNGDRPLLLHFLRRTYREFFPEQGDLSHLADTVKQYFSADTPFWIVEGEGKSIAGLWMGNAVDQVTGERYGHIFLVYVDPDHRRRGIATELIDRARRWATDRGQKQIGLQVFLINENALSLYRHLGFQARSLLMTRRF